MVSALEIGFAIKNRRRELGVTQAQVAKAAGVSDRCLWSLELGQNPGAQLDKLIAVLTVLGLDLKLETGSAADAPIIAPANDEPAADTGTEASSFPPDAITSDIAAAILTGGKRE